MAPPQGEWRGGGRARAQLPAAGAAALLAACVLSALLGRAEGVTAFFLVPVYEWVPVWRETRNINYVLGGIWRPRVIAEPNTFPGVRNVELQGYNVMDFVSPAAFVVYLGDVWQAGRGAPDFVGTVLLLDPQFPDAECPPGVPCFLRDEAEYAAQGAYTGILTVTPDRGSFTTVWSAHMSQCKEQSPVGVPDLCDGADLAAGVCVPESGFRVGVAPVTFQKPTCPNDFYVMGHVALYGANGTIKAEQPMQQYKCLHESVLRQTGWAAEPMMTGAQPRTSVYNDRMFAFKYDKPISLWTADCSAESCGGWPFCADTISIGLFYASGSESSPDNVITGLPSNTKATGPRCLVHYRKCTELQVDGKFRSNPAGNSSTSFVSLCESELGLRTKLPKVRTVGITSVQPSGIPFRADLPVPVTIRANRDVCTNVILQDDDNLNEGIVYINRIRTQWVSMQVGGSCSFQIRIPMTGQIKPGPATIEVTTKKAGTIASRVKDTTGTYTGLYIGRLYVYLEPEMNATLIEPVVYNGPLCELRTVVKLPVFTQTIQYNTNTFLCEFRDAGVSLLSAGISVRANNLLLRERSLRGLECFIPQRTTGTLSLSVSINGGVNWHHIEQKLTRLADGGITEVPGEGALRLYDVVPRVGPQEGGTLVTVLGQHFSLYCDGGNVTRRCNKIMCSFRYEVGGRVTTKNVRSTLVDDKTLLCVTPKAETQASQAQLEISIDGNPACAQDTFNNIAYNVVPFYYQTDQTPLGIPSATTPVNPNPRDAPHRLQGPWISCSSTNCTGMPHVTDDVAVFGYYMCLPGFNRSDGTPSDVTYPAWCIRALPINAAASYQFTVTDALFRTTAFVQRPVPELFPGYCHRTTHHLPWERLKHPLDYRVIDAYDFSYQLGDPIPRGKQTQGRALIDRIFSTTALTLRPGVSLEYMRNVMHQIGDRDGFIDISLAFHMLIDFTLARGYDEVTFRSTVSCAKANPPYGLFSGFLGDTGPTGSYIDWLNINWVRGKPACSDDERWRGQCKHEIRFSPDKRDDIGVMLTEPAMAIVEQNSEDRVVGCGRLRVGFDCANFDFEECLSSEFKRTPDSAYSNLGAGTKYTSLSNFCDFAYPEATGPNNPGRPGSTPVLEDWRYFSRTSPCVKCRQSRDICAALLRPEPIQDNVPVGPAKRSLGDTNFAAEISLGCFGPAAADIGGGVEDECCENVASAPDTPPLPGDCGLTLERCVRSRMKNICARNEDLDPTRCSGQSCGVGCRDLPLCVPKGLV